VQRGWSLPNTRPLSRARRGGESGIGVPAIGTSYRDFIGREAARQLPFKEGWPQRMHLDYQFGRITRL
jgi:hypothetical protein